MSYNDEETRDFNIYSLEDLKGMSLPALKKLATKKSIIVSGLTKIEIINKINTIGNKNLEDNTVQDTEDYSSLIKKWFMNPIVSSRNPCLQKGIINEKYLLNNLPYFLKIATNGEIDIIESKEYGLCSLPGFDFMATSFDGIVAYKKINGLYETMFPAIVEIKTMTTIGTLEDAVIRSNNEKYVFIKLSTAHSDVFKERIPNKSYRCQLLHHCASTNTNEIFYVVGSTVEIIQVIHIEFSPELLSSYQEVLKLFASESSIFKWISTKDISKIPKLKINFKDMYIDSIDSLKQSFIIWCAIQEKIKANNNLPLPSCIFSIICNFFVKII